MPHAGSASGGTESPDRPPDGSSDAFRSGPSVGPAAPPLAVRLGSRAEFAELRRFLEDAGYTTQAIRERRGSASMDVPSGEEVHGSATDVAELLTRVFFDGSAIARSEFLRHVPPQIVDLMVRLGVLTTELDPDRCWAPLALYPTSGLFLVSDHRRVFGGGATGVPEDVIYPALADTTVEFLRALPTEPCDRLLDIGAGTGVAALLGAVHGAREAFAVDITERSTLAATFNAALNGLDAVTALRGDLYGPVSELDFDRIVAHPPYMPEDDDRLIFRDGGADGERITRRIVAGLVKHLRPGGRFHCRCMATDREDGPFEGRLRAMLGDRHGEFDVVVLARAEMAVEEFLCRFLLSEGMPPGAHRRKLDRLKALGVRTMLVGSTLIERHESPRAPITIRRRWSGPGDPTFDDVMRPYSWERARSVPGFSRRLLEVKPSVSPEAEIRLAHRMVGGEMRATSCRVSMQAPILFSVESTPSLALLLGSFTGERTVAEAYEEMRRVGAASPEATLEEYLGLVAALIGGGVLGSADEWMT